MRVEVSVWDLSWVEGSRIGVKGGGYLRCWWCGGYIYLGFFLLGFLGSTSYTSLSGFHYR